MSRQGSRTGNSAATRRGTRARRLTALTGMLFAVNALVTVRSALTPPPTQALASGGLAVAVGGTAPPAATAKPSASPPASKPSSAAQSAAPVQQSQKVRHITGDAYNVHYGVVQVRVTLTGKRITDITAISLPQGGRSGDISSYAEPLLRQEGLTKQSARIDSVSGASYTSAGYAQSLQSALDKSGS